MRPSKRNEVIEATIKLISEHGIHNVPTIKIAEQAGVAEITVFRNFQTKESLLVATFDEVLKRAQSFIYDDLDESLPSQERFLQMCDRFCLFKESRPQEFDVFEQFYLLPIWERRDYLTDQVGTTDFTKGHPNGLINLLLDGQNGGWIKTIPIATLMGMILGTFFHISPNCPDDIKLRTFQMLWDAVAA